MSKSAAPKKKSCIAKLFGFIFKVIAIVAAITACYVMIKKKLAQKREAGNFNRIIKEYFNYFGNKVVKPEEGKFEGTLLKSVCGTNVIDLGDNYFTEESFISLETLASVVTIIVPEGVKVALDGLYKASSVTSDAPAPCGDDSAVLYIAVRATASTVKVIVRD